ncbi:MAG: AAA family ATPase [Defluviitaleaceae bacterium]|nr:AAA family ATPase [Defluviitaleaceae bacterium]
MDAMDNPHGIIVFGANGAGKTTIARELARILNYRHMDIEDYYFEKSEVPYTVARSREDCLSMMLADIEKYRAFVLSAVTGDFGGAITRFYELGVYVSAPLELRMERIRRRAYEQYGKRVQAGGDMHEREAEFLDFAASRPLEKIERWAETLTCPVIRIDGTVDWRVNAAYAAERAMKRTYGGEIGIH